MKNSKTFTELGRTKINDNRILVVSRNNELGGYTMAQQITVNEDKHTMSIFIKGAVHVGDLDGLMNLKHCIDEIVEKECKNL